MAANQTLTFGQFVKRHTRSRAVPVLVIAALLALWRFFLPGFESTYNHLDPFITLTTLGLTFFVWYQQLREEWEEDHLPKRLTVEFVLGSDIVMLCENAHLAGESDIRALAQQIGMQMNGGAQLQFAAPAVEISPPRLNESERRIEYNVKVRLTEKPIALTKATLAHRAWRDPFLKMDGSPNFIETKIRDQGNFAPMLLNLSNHPKTKWDERQLVAAASEFGAVEDIPFPQIDPGASLEDVARIAYEYADKCEQVLNARSDELNAVSGPPVGGTESRTTNESNAVHLMGEFTFTYQFLKEMERRGIPCVASTTERIVADNPDGSKTTVFKFVQFRPYF
jgi:hypothetical protein